jgi:hypothetical protein
MRLRVFVTAALVALVVPASIAVGRTAKGHPHGNHQKASIVGTWDVKVSPDGAAPFAAMLVINRDGSVIETEADAPGTGLGAWKRLGGGRFALAFRSFFLNAQGQPAGSVLVRSQVTVNGDSVSGPFKFDVSDPSGKVVQSGSGTASATRFVIPPL